MRKLKIALIGLSNLLAAAVATVLLEDPIRSVKARLYEADWASFLTLLKTNPSIQFLLLSFILIAGFNWLYLRQSRNEPTPRGIGIIEITFSCFALTQVLLLAYYTAIGQFEALVVHYKSDPLGNFTGLLAAGVFLIVGIIRTIGRPAREQYIAKMAVLKYRNEEASRQLDDNMERMRKAVHRNTELTDKITAADAKNLEAIKTLTSEINGLTNKSTGGTMSPYKG